LADEDGALKTKSRVVWREKFLKYIVNGGRKSLSSKGEGHCVAG